MLELSFVQLQAWLALFLWPFMRIAAFVTAAPLLSHSSVPSPVKIGLAALLAVVVAGILPPLPDVALVSWAGVGIIIEQLLIGLSMGLVMQIVFAVVQAAGELIGLQMGLAFATFFSPDTGANTMILSRLLYMITLLMFLAFDGHLLLIEILALSFSTLPVGAAQLDAGAFELLALFGGVIFTSGMVMALPLIATLLIMNLAMGILNRTAPQFTVFSIGFPMTLLAGLVLLTVQMNDLGRFLERLFVQGLQFLQQLVESLAGL